VTLVGLILVFITIAVASTVALGVWWRARGGRGLLPGPEALGATPDGRARFYALVPLILGLHAGLPLIGLCLLFGIFTRAIVATAWLLINMTALALQFWLGCWWGRTVGANPLSTRNGGRSSDGNPMSGVKRRETRVRRDIATGRC
jgi:hypothetical protein